MKSLRDELGMIIRLHLGGSWRVATEGETLFMPKAIHASLAIHDTE